MLFDYVIVVWFDHLHLVVGRHLHVFSTFFICLFYFVSIFL